MAEQLWLEAWWLEALGWVGSAVLVVSLLQTQLLRLRLINLVGCVILIGYNATLSVWPMVGLNVVLAAVNVTYLWRMLRTRHDAAAFTVLEVDPGETYLRHLLRIHEEDIRVFNPGFVHDPSADQLACLVLRGEETVGVVLARDAGAGVAQVHLDWVTPRYRDLSPGEFVYRTSDVFTSHGFRRVLSPQGMVSSHYERLGFRPAEDRWSLELS